MLLRGIGVFLFSRSSGALLKYEITVDFNARGASAMYLVVLK